MSKRTALVTGGAGFIGSNLTKRLLAAGWDVRILDNLSSGYKSNLAPFPQAEFVEGDIRDEAVLDRVMPGVDTVFHMAASVGNVRSIENSVLDSEVNVLGTLRVLEAARRHGVRKIVYCSSAAIFGEPRELPMKEDHPFAPDSPYGVSKLAGELQIMCFAKLHGLQAVCLRYFNVYGPNQRFDAYGNVIPIWVQRALDGQPLKVYGDGEQTRDFVNVADVAQANMLAAESDVTGVFNIGAGKAITINALSNLIKGALESDVPVEHVAPRKGEVLHSLADVSAATAALGYEPEVSLEEGLVEYTAWMRSEQPAKAEAAR